MIVEAKRQRKINSNHLMFLLPCYTISCKLQQRALLEVEVGKEDADDTQVHCSQGFDIFFQLK